MLGFTASRTVRNEFPFCSLRQSVTAAQSRVEKNGHQEWVLLKWPPNRRCGFGTGQGQGEEIVGEDKRAATGVSGQFWC
jgi:hypothetical protein